MLRFAVLMLAATVSAIPIEDTPEVAEARAAHLALVEEAKAGLHAAKAPVNNDVQAAQIATAYIADTADVAAAKEEFLAAFADVEAGGLAAKQAPAPVHEVAAPVANVVLPTSHIGYAALNHAAVPVTALNAVYPPVSYALPTYHHTYTIPTYTTAHLGYAGLGLPYYGGLPLVTVKAAEEPAAVDVE